MNLGAYDFLTKPIEINDVVFTLNKTIQHIISLMKTVTARRQAEKALDQERTILRTLIDAIPDLMYLKDTQGHFLLNNTASVRALGAPSDVIGKTDADVFPKELAERYADDEHKILQTGQPLINREEPGLNLETGEMRWVLTTKVPLRDDQGNITGLVGIHRDITAIKQARESLKMSHRQYRELAEHADDGLVVVQEGNVVFVNAALCSLVGDTPDQILQRSPDNLLLTDPGDSAGKPGAFVEKTESDDFWHVLHTRSDGREIWLETHQRRIHGDGKPAILVRIRDITAQKLHEMAIEAEKTHLRNENLALRGILRTPDRLGDLVGRSSAMQAVYERIFQAAKTEQPVVIVGETGTGKDLVARTIHHLSERYTHAFVSMNCGAIPDNLFESEFFGYRKGAFTGAHADKPGLLDKAHLGTLFLDEVAELRPEEQVKLGISITLWAPDVQINRQRFH